MFFKEVHRPLVALILDNQPFCDEGMALRHPTKRHSPVYNENYEKAVCDHCHNRSRKIEAFCFTEKEKALRGEKIDCFMF